MCSAKVFCKGSTACTTYCFYFLVFYFLVNNNANNMRQPLNDSRHTKGTRTKTGYTHTDINSSSSSSPENEHTAVSQA